MDLHVRSREEIETKPLPGPSAVICMADSAEQLATIRDTANVIARLDLIFNDATDPFGNVLAPTENHVRQILQFVDQQSSAPFLVAQCQVGIGRSHAVVGALLKIHGGNPKPLLSKGTYNRRLYRMLLREAGVAHDPEPLASMTVRVKYPPDRLKLFLLSMQRQRYENWELIAVTDGPNPQAAAMIRETNDPRIRLIETDKPLGRWGHPYRQLALDACRGEFIGMSNDDNYYVPGYLEQMVNALGNADLAMCTVVHSYAGWEVTPAGSDLGSWMARASLIRQIPWPGLDFSSDATYLRALIGAAKGRVAKIDRPLFVHN